jgi:hypothetical protein
MLTSAVLNMSNIIPLGYPDVNADDTPANARFKPGAIGFFVDNFGMKYLRYIRNMRGSAFVLGDVVRRIADVTVASITSGTVSSITKTSGFTANAHSGKLMIYETASVAGAVPEGETGLIRTQRASHSSTRSIRCRRLGRPADPRADLPRRHCRRRRAGARRARLHHGRERDRGR